uniref:Uncharacterized protein n=1 Tax=Macrostomum lignano TaxID=282301 RepID=A0A1I8I7V3_9PLAT
MRSDSQMLLSHSKIYKKRKPPWRTLFSR